MKTNKFVRVNDTHQLFLDVISGVVYLVPDQDRDQLEEKSYSTTEIKRYLSEFEEVLMALPKIHAFVINHKCNYRCSFCFEDRNSRDKSLQISSSQVMKIFELIDQEDQEKKALLHLYGGEPLLPENYEIVKLIIQEGLKRKFRFFIPTNGYYLNEYLDLLEDVPMNLQITLDGMADTYNQRRQNQPDEDLFAKVIKNIDMAVKQGIKITIRLNVDETNIDEIQDLLDLFIEKDWLPNHVRAYFAPTRTDRGRCFRWYPEEVFEKIQSSGLTNITGVSLSKEMDGNLFGPNGLKPLFYNCSACYRQFFYDGRGDIYPCAESIGNLDFKIGQFEPDLTFNENHEKLRKRNVLELSNKCSDCDNLLFCGGGCAYRAMLETGDLTSSECGNYQEIEKYLSMLARHRGNI